MLQHDTLFTQGDSLQVGDFGGTLISLLAQVVPSGCRIPHFSCLFFQTCWCIASRYAACWRQPDNWIEREIALRRFCLHFLSENKAFPKSLQKIWSVRSLSHGAYTCKYWMVCYLFISVTKHLTETPKGEKDSYWFLVSQVIVHGQLTLLHMVRQKDHGRSLAEKNCLLHGNQEAESQGKEPERRTRARSTLTVPSPVIWFFQLGPTSQ